MEASEPVREDEAPVTPAAQMAAQAKTATLRSAVQARSDRRPPATAQEIAVPLISAANYLADAVLDLQGQIARIERTLLQLADAGRLKS